MKRPLLIAAGLLVVLAACQPPPPPPRPGAPPPGGFPPGPSGAGQTQPDIAPAGSGQAQPTTAPSGGGQTQPQATSAPAAAVDIEKLPIGDNNLTTSGPGVGKLWSCAPPNPNAGGASATGDWYDSAAGTWNYNLKPLVDGSVTWPHEFSVQVSGSTRTITSNNLPAYGTGTYPVSAGDDAAQFDRNPNQIAAQQIMLELPAMPQVASQPSCAPGTTGILLDGVLLFNAADGPGRDAFAHEIMDSCDGHPQRDGQYHHHAMSRCIEDPGSGHSNLVGYAFDGFGIFGKRGENGETLTNAALDECHGHTHTIQWDGQSIEMYHYHATWEYPYTVGCLRGRLSVDIRALNGG